MSNHRREIAWSVGLLCFTGVLGIAGVAPTSAQEVRSSQDLEARASEAATAVDALRASEVVSQQRTIETSRPDRAEMLESASGLLQEIAGKASGGADVSDTRDEMTRVARLLDNAYSAAIRAGAPPDADQVAALTSLLNDLDDYYNPKANDSP